MLADALILLTLRVVTRLETTRTAFNKSVTSVAVAPLCGFETDSSTGPGRMQGQQLFGLDECMSWVSG